jgi:hypothetical protein
VANFNLYDNGLLEKVCAMAVLTMVLTTGVLLVARRLTCVGMQGPHDNARRPTTDPQPIAAGG